MERSLDSRSSGRDLFNPCMLYSHAHSFLVLLVSSTRLGNDIRASAEVAPDNVSRVTPSLVEGTTARVTSSVSLSNGNSNHSNANVYQLILAPAGSLEFTSSPHHNDSVYDASGRMEYSPRSTAKASYQQGKRNHSNSDIVTNIINYCISFRINRSRG
jgi:hypothetical protein